MLARFKKAVLTCEPGSKMAPTTPVTLRARSDELELTSVYKASDRWVDEAESRRAARFEDELQV